MKLRRAFLTALIAMAHYVVAQENVVPYVTLPEVLIQEVSTGAVRSFARTEIEKSGARNVAEFLAQCSGVQLRDDGASGGKQFARMGGSNVNQVLVLVDGMRYDDVGSGEADLSRIPAEWIESVEVTTGASLHGAEAIGGVISIRTIHGTSNSMKLNASGSTTNSEASLLQEWQHEKTRFVAGVMRDQGSGSYRFRITEYDGNGPFTQDLGREFRRQNNKLVRDKVFGKIEHEVGQGSLSAALWLERGEFGLPGYLAPRPTPMASQTEAFRNVQVGWNQPSTMGRFAVGASSQEQQKDFTDPDPLSYLKESHEASDRLSASGSWQHEILGNTAIATARVEREKLASGILENQQATRNRWQSSLSLSRVVSFDRLTRHRLNTTSSLNFERFGDSDVQTLPQAELSYSYAGSFLGSIGVRGAQSYLAPSFYSLFWNDELLAQGNPDLRPESATMWQAFVRLVTKSAYTTSIDVSATRNRVTDLIYWRQAFDGRWTPQNLRTASLDDLSVTIRQQLVPGHASMQSSMEWLDARDRSGDRLTDGKYLIYRPAKTFRASADVNSHGYRGLMQVRLVDKQAVLETNSKWLPEFTLVDAEVARSFAIRASSWDIGVRCENVFDVDYRLVRHAPMPLRQFWMFLSLQLGSEK